MLDNFIKDFMNYLRDSGAPLVLSDETAMFYGFGLGNKPETLEFITCDIQPANYFNEFCQQYGAKLVTISDISCVYTGMLYFENNYNIKVICKVLRRPNLGSIATYNGLRCPSIETVLIQIVSKYIKSHECIDLNNAVLLYTTYKYMISDDTKIMIAIILTQERDVYQLERTFRMCDQSLVQIFMEDLGLEFNIQ